MAFYEEVLGRYLSAEQLQEIGSWKIGLAGLGGLGSNCAVHLVRTGFRRLVLVDFDLVEPSNLNRQFYFPDQIGQAKASALRDNLLRINPDLDLAVHQICLTRDNLDHYFHDCDIIVEAFDTPEAKQMLAAAYLHSDKLLVSASGLAGWGQSDRIRTHRLKDRFILVGDLETAVDATHPPLAPRVQIAAAKMADAILEYVFNSKG
ncbi:MAG TPA: sulfur carrier protein ThiS adenylyltransferase ThiF [Firmicutes bacterium]|jgi:sulfur carrier protein ThiS adenylyltransferase|nr:sulfur carrier protein ThiS adenylyltransferase ThiF [Bacillota bacterium]HOQ24517.1 sulfur carrier protein ThiS adenylyltransferase ThiF [Bacillota bacterium]HPT67343.1 sulfur carrier protein ThiS adenylyltransferase ThiF [Bacillota bacterium]